MSRRSGSLMLALSVALGTSACGYGVVRADRLFAATRIAVVPFAEREPNGLSAPLAQGLSQRLASGGIEVSSWGQGAEATLAGEVHVSNAPSATLRGVQTYAVVAHIEARLRDAADDVLWQRDFDLREEFLPTDPTQDIQPLVSEARRRTALVRLAERAAMAVHEAVVLDHFTQTAPESFK